MFTTLLRYILFVGFLNDTIGTQSIKLQEGCGCKVALQTLLNRKIVKYYNGIVLHLLGFGFLY